MFETEHFGVEITQNIWWKLLKCLYYIVYVYCDISDITVTCIIT